MPTTTRAANASGSITSGAETYESATRAGYAMSVNSVG